MGEKSCCVEIRKTNEQESWASLSSKVWLHSSELQSRSFNLTEELEKLGFKMGFWKIHCRCRLGV